MVIEGVLIFKGLGKKSHEEILTQIMTSPRGYLYEGNVSNQKDRSLEEILFIIFEMSVLGTEDFLAQFFL